jgi:hypothetical protein
MVAVRYVVMLTSGEVSVDYVSPRKMQRFKECPFISDYPHQKVYMDYDGIETEPSWQVTASIYL